MTDEELKALHKPLGSGGVKPKYEDLLDQLTEKKPWHPHFGKPEYPHFGGRPERPHMQMIKDLLEQFKQSMYQGDEGEWMHQLHIERETRFKVMVHSIQAQHGK